MDIKKIHTKEQAEHAMRDCEKLVPPVKTEIWEYLAQHYGYKNGNSLRMTFRDWKKKQEEKRYLTGAVISDRVFVDDENTEYQKQCSSGAGQGFRKDIIKAIAIPNIKNELKKDVEKGISIKEALDKYQIQLSTLEDHIDRLRKTGLNISITRDIIHITKYVVHQDNVTEKEWDGCQKIKFGVISDTHIGSKHQQLTLMNKIYDTFQMEQIADVYHAGDISEGIKMRPGHEQECFLHGADDIENYIIENFPKRDGITTNFITGNHDHSMIKQSGHDIGVNIAKERSDMNYLGMANAKVLITPKCTMELNHPLDGASYALSYSIQKLADSLSGGEKPNILINGHHHKAMYLFYRNIHMIEAGCFEAQTPWMKGKRIAAHVGGYIVTVYVSEDGEIKRFIPEFIPFYEMIKNDWR